MPESDTKLKEAIKKYMKKIQADLYRRGNLSEDVVVSYGPRWAKIMGSQIRYKGRRAMYFVDLRKGPTYGFLHEAESWARPRRWHMGSVINKV